MNIKTTEYAPKCSAELKKYANAGSPKGTSDASFDRTITETNVSITADELKAMCTVLNVIEENMDSNAERFTYPVLFNTEFNSSFDQHRCTVPNHYILRFAESVESDFVGMPELDGQLLMNPDFHITIKSNESGEDTFINESNGYKATALHDDLANPSISTYKIVEILHKLKVSDTAVCDIILKQLADFTDNYNEETKEFTFTHINNRAN